MIDDSWAILKHEGYHVWLDKDDTSISPVTLSSFKVMCQVKSEFLQLMTQNNHVFMSI